MARGNPIATNRSVHRPKGKMTPAYIRDTRHIAVKVFTDLTMLIVAIWLWLRPEPVSSEAR